MIINSVSTLANSTGIRWALVALWCAVIFVLSAQRELPGPNDVVLDAIFKKCGHLSAYAVLMFLLLSAFNAMPKPAARSILMGFGLLVVYASSDELHQSFVPGRTAQFIDVLIDSVGGLIGLITWRGLHGSGMGRLRYWATFAFAAWVLLMLNLPWKQLPPQDMSVIFRDPWILLGLCLFSLFLIGITNLLIEDARARGIRWWLFVPPYFFVGILALAPYLALRPKQQTGSLRQQPRFGWLYVLLPVAAIASILILLPANSWPVFWDSTSHSLGFAFMWLDIALNLICVLPLVLADMVRRGTGQRAAWIAAIALTGPIGLGAYLASRSVLRIQKHL